MVDILPRDRGWRVEEGDGDWSQIIQKGWKVMGKHHMISRPIIIEVVEEWWKLTIKAKRVFNPKVENP
ncbi:MAG: hypothetical protein JEZ12_19060 [Desulfobacterium sp.]|nr:hypothetical protein [Desulfobacterium sp.]